MEKDFADQAYDAACAEIGAAVIEVVSSGHAVMHQAIKDALIRY